MRGRVSGLAAPGRAKPLLAPAITTVIKFVPVALVERIRVNTGLIRCPQEDVIAHEV